MVPSVGALKKCRSYKFYWGWGCLGGSVKRKLEQDVQILKII